MKRVLVVLLTLVSTSAPAGELMLVPKDSMEAMVIENLRQQALIEQLLEGLNAQHKHIQRLQSATNCV